MTQLFAGLIAVFVAAVPVGAQSVGDHLKCYKIKDPQAKASYTADLDGLVAEPGCRIKVPATTACVPSTKTNITPPPPSGGGSGIPNSFFCYKVKCPKVALPTLNGTDQFGSRTVTPSAAKLLCAPLAGPPTSMPTSTTMSTTTTTTTTSCPLATAAYCGGANCGEGGMPGCGPEAFCPQGTICTTTGMTCGCTGATIPCGDPRLSGLTCNFCKWGTCPPGMTCGGVPKSGACGFDCACH